jgi:hypothetical protein
LRAHLSCLECRITYAYALRSCFEAIEEFVFDSLFNEEPRARATNLALIEEDPHHRAVNRLLKIGIRENDVGRLTAKLK